MPRLVFFFPSWPLGKGKQQRREATVFLALFKLILAESETVCFVRLSVRCLYPVVNPADLTVTSQAHPCVIEVF